jgi:Ca2+-binding RTX toxin-like protein
VLGGAAGSVDATTRTWDGNIGQYVGNDYTGGTGNDTLRGTSSNDTYHYAVGDGADTLNEISGSDLMILNGINHDQLWFQREGDDLVMSLIGTDDRITFNDWYLSNSNQVETIEASDDQWLTNTALDQLVTAMSILTPPAMGEMTLPADLQQELSPVLASAWQVS